MSYYLEGVLEHPLDLSLVYVCIDNLDGQVSVMYHRAVGSKVSTDARYLLSSPTYRILKKLDQGHNSIRERTIGKQFGGQDCQATS